MIKDQKSDPLLESLLFLCQYHGLTSTAETLTAGLPLQDGHLSPSLFDRAARRVGITTNLTRKPLLNLQHSLLPSVLLLDNDECCILLGWSDDQKTAKICHPELPDAKMEMSREELEQSYSGIAILAKPKFRFDKRTSSVSHNNHKHWFWSVFKENIPLYRDVLFAALFINLFALALPIFTMNIYDRVVPNQAIETLWMLALGVSLVLLMDVVLKTLRGYFLDVASKRIDIKLSARIMEQVLGSRLESRPESVGSFASNLRAFESIRDFITSITLSIIIDLPFIFIFLIVIFWIAPLMALPMFIAMILIMTYGLMVRKSMQELTETSYRASALRNATLIESLVGLETLKAMGAESVMQQRWEKTAAFLAKIGVKQRMLAQSNGNIGMWVQQMTSVAMIITGVYLITDGLLTMGGLIACTMLASRGIAPIGQASGLLLQYHTARAAMTSLDEIMAKPLECPNDTNFLSRTQYKGDIEFRNVSFKYPNQDTPVLKSVSFKISAGEHVAILGRNGSGKSTLSKLILGLYQPTEGAVLIDGIDLRQLNPSELRQHIGYMPQDITLFYGSLRENIVLAHPFADDEDVVRAAKLANLGDFVNVHPQGFDMLVGERGDSLSGGQRKAVGIARAVIHNPPILILDEPTGSMDHTTESHVKDELAQFTKDRTLFVVTHRTSLLDMIHRIIVVEAGQIVANGPKDSVVEALRSGRIGKP